MNTPLLLAPAQEEEVRRIAAEMAKAWDAVDRGLAAAEALLPRPVPVEELPHCHVAYQAFLRVTSEWAHRMQALYIDPARAESVRLAEPDTTRRLDLLHRLHGAGFSQHPPVAEWYRDVARRRALAPLFRGVE